MQQLEKAPRWFLTLALAAAMGISGLCITALLKQAYADIAKNATSVQDVKVIAYQAKRTAEEAQMQIAEMRGAIQEIKVGNETFRKEYRQDNKEILEALRKHT